MTRSDVTPAELAQRVRVRGLRLEEPQACAFLLDWQRRGIAEQRDGRWRLTRSGRAMFGGWVVGLHDGDQERGS